MQAFTSRFLLTDGPRHPGPHEPTTTVDQLFARFGRSTFAGGLYRIHDSVSSVQASAMVTEAFPEMSVPILCFGFDWLGRQFAIDRSDPEAEILMFIPGTGDVLDIPVSFSDFHDRGLIEFAEDALALSYYEDWRATAPGDLPFDMCAGFKIPLFLGGRDEIDNLEAIDIDVYWSLMGQLRLATQGEAPGTDIHGVEISD